MSKNAIVLCACSIVGVATISVSAVRGAVIEGYDFTGAAGSQATSSASTTASNTDAGANNLTRGTTAAGSAAGNSFRTLGFKNDGISTANTDYFQFTASASSGYTLSLTSIDSKFAGTASYYASPGVTTQYAYSTNGSTFTLIGSPIASTSASLSTSVSLSGISALQNVVDSTTVTFRFYASGQTSSGGFGYFSSASGTNGLALNGTVDPVVVPGSATAALATAAVGTNVGAASPNGSGGSYDIVNIATPGVTDGSVSIGGNLANSTDPVYIYLDRANDGTAFPTISGVTFTDGTYNFGNGVTYDALAMFTTRPAPTDPIYFNFSGLPALNNIGIVPEPATLFGVVGIAGMTLLRRRNKRA